MTTYGAVLGATYGAIPGTTYGNAPTSSIVAVIHGTAVDGRSTTTATDGRHNVLLQEER